MTSSVLNLQTTALMRQLLKPIERQVIVITGASSGIGLATAELAAEEGARLVLAARSAQALEDIVTNFRSRGVDAIAVACDVGNRADVERLAQAAIDRFGTIDTWINDAGVAIYGRLDEVTEADARQLFETNFWGVVHGSLVALPHLRRSGGALINVGSEVSEAAIPLLGMYTASKHAVKGFTDSLRVEVEEVDKAPISIALIQPSATDTPFPQHGRNYMDREPKLPTPRMAPRKVAAAILEAAIKPTRNKKVGAMATFNTLLAKFLPRFADSQAAKYVDRQQYDEPPRHPEGALYHSSEATDVVGQERGTGGVEASQ
jgi:short-subunit dehydrogenase